MKKKLTRQETFFLGSMLFGLFFGAGNLIFPVNMGQNAGDSALNANIGFVLTAVGLPFLGVLAMGVSGSTGVQQLAERVNKKYAMIFTVLLYLSIGPLFATPRLATTSFTVGIQPFLPEPFHKVGLFLFSAVFFLLAWYLSRHAEKILDIVGKFLNPLFLILLGVLLFLVFAFPMGSLTHAPMSTIYEASPFFEGFKNGYQTLDALAALAFGILFINTVKNLGIESKSDIAKQTVKSGFVVVLLMTIIYTALTFSGVLSLGKFQASENGGIALAEIANFYLGRPGGILLALIITCACLKTGIGLITAFSEALHEMFPSISYERASIVAALLPAIFANVGLTAIIQVAVPVLMFIYPLAITLILLVLLETLIGYRKEVYVWVTGFTLISALLDGLNASAEIIRSNVVVESLLSIAYHLPFFDIGMGWIIPAILGFIIGFALSLLKNNDGNQVYQSEA